LVHRVKVSLRVAVDRGGRRVESSVKKMREIKSDTESNSLLVVLNIGVVKCHFIVKQ